MAEQQAPGMWHTDLQRQDLSVRLGRFTRCGMLQRQRGGLATYAVDEGKPLLTLAE
jgi:hypothetical protein